MYSVRQNGCLASAGRLPNPGATVEGPCVRPCPLRMLNRGGWFLGLVLTSIVSQGAALLEVGTAVGQPGSTTRLPIRLQSDTPVVAGEFEVLHQSPYLDGESAEPGNPATGHRVLSANPTSGRQRVVIYSLENEALRDGSIVQLPYRIAANAPKGVVSVSLTNAQFVAADGTLVEPISQASGQLTITLVAPAIFNSITRQASGVVELHLSGTAGETYTVQWSSALGAAWSNLSTNVATNGIIQVQDATAGETQRYYRAVAEP